MHTASPKFGKCLQINPSFLHEISRRDHEERRLESESDQLILKRRLLCQSGLDSNEKSGKIVPVEPKFSQNYR